MDFNYKYFVQINTSKGPTYRCWLCKGQSTKNRNRHCLNKRHQDFVRADNEQHSRVASRRAAARVSNEEVFVVNNNISQIESLVFEDQEDSQAEELESNRSEAIHEPNIVPLDIFEEEDSDNETDNAAELTWMQFLELAIGQISSEPDELADVDSIPSFRQEEVKIEDVTPDSSVWFPFPSKEYLIGSLLIGYLHKLISRDLYHQIRTIFTLYAIGLPGWEALRIMRAKIRSMSNHSIIQRESVFNQPMFGLDARQLISDVSTYFLVVLLEHDKLNEISYRFFAGSNESIGSTTFGICAGGCAGIEYLQVFSVSQVAQTL
ncbi:hypothetical protein PGT21_023248 [Puccinia graminis f. sp. tritici]|uniref:Uncharacterized protein n=1 Tax=Puccinia graminis f. sp. tritici TaxID=56615 RepID=A0A5B0QIM2_PUCGR|nr:hypothetical protein PGT21_023248 [Puccinia graminis f. sp. tritici]